MNIVCQKEKAIYIAIPKVACGSIKRAVASGIGLKGDDRKIHGIRFGWRTIQKKHIREKKDDGWLVWAFVRNPWDRLVSCWAHKFDQFAGNRKMSPLFPRLPADLSWDDFLRWVVSQEPRTANDHFRPQHYFLTDREGPKIGTTFCRPDQGAYLPQLTGRLEHVDRDWKQVQAMWGWPDLMNVNPSRHKPYQEMFTPGQRRLVSGWCEPDAELLGYRF